MNLFVVLVFQSFERNLGTYGIKDKDLKLDVCSNHERVLKKKRFNIIFVFNQTCYKVGGLPRSKLSFYPKSHLTLSNPLQQINYFTLSLK